MIVVDNALCVKGK